MFFHHSYQMTQPPAVVQTKVTMTLLPLAQMQPFARTRTHARSSRHRGRRLARQALVTSHTSLLPPEEGKVLTWCVVARFGILEESQGPHSAATPRRSTTIRALPTKWIWRPKSCFPPHGHPLSRVCASLRGCSRQRPNWLFVAAS